MRTRKKQGQSNPNSLANLEKGKFQKGVSGNPLGNYKGTKHRYTIFRYWLETETNTEDLDGKPIRVSVEDSVILALIKKAKDGDVSAIREVLDSLYGKIDQKLAIESTPQFKNAKDILIYNFKTSIESAGINIETLSEEDKTALESAFGQYLVRQMNLWNEMS